MNYKILSVIMLIAGYAVYQWGYSDSTADQNQANTEVVNHALNKYQKEVALNQRESESLRLESAADKDRIQELVNDLTRHGTGCGTSYDLSLLNEAKRDKRLPSPRLP